MRELFPISVDKDLQIRLLEKRNAASLYRLVDVSREHLRKWLPFVDDYRSVNAATEFIVRCSKMCSKRSGLGMGIWYRNDLAGVTTYDYLDWNNGATRIGYWLGSGFEGKGLMTHTCRALVEVALDKLGLNRVEIWCASQNDRCRRVPERLGFKLEGTFRERERVFDRFVDMVSYSVLTHEWENRMADGQTRM